MAQRHPAQNAFAPLLRPFGLLYGCIMRARRALYHAGALKTEACPRPCVCVGNISWGGTGKTPVVDWLLGWAENHGRAAVVLTRGYGGSPPSLPWKVETGDSPAWSGDEPLMLAQKRPHAVILADPDRNRAARYAMSGVFPIPDLFILDDGFQRLATGRDMNLVLLDKDDIPEQPSSHWNRVIPAGTWREPVSALEDASAFLIKADPEEWAALAPALETRLAAFPRPVFAFCLEPAELRPLPSSPGSEVLPPEALSGDYALVTGVGNPAQVRHTLERFLGRSPAKELVFPDHHDFAGDRAALAALGMPAVCTAKDAVKLARLELSQFFLLETNARFHAHTGPDAFESWLDAAWASLFARAASRIQAAR